MMEFLESNTKASKYEILSSEFGLMVLQDIIIHTNTYGYYRLLAGIERLRLA